MTLRKQVPEKWDGGYWYVASELPRPFPARAGGFALRAEVDGEEVWLLRLSVPLQRVTPASATSAAILAAAEEPRKMRIRIGGL